MTGTVDVSVMKEYLLIDGSLQDDVIKDFIDAAKQELEFSGVPDNAKDTPLYNLAVKILVSRNFEDRAATGKANMNLDYILTKLKISGGESVGLQQTEV